MNWTHALHCHQNESSCNRFIQKCITLDGTSPHIAYNVLKSSWWSIWSVLWCLDAYSRPQCCDSRQSGWLNHSYQQSPFPISTSLSLLIIPRHNNDPLPKIFSYIVAIVLTCKSTCCNDSVSPFILSSDCGLWRWLCLWLCVSTLPHPCFISLLQFFLVIYISVSHFASA